MSDHTAVRERLRAELATLARRHDALESHLRNTDRDLPDDFADLATAINNDEVMEGLDDLTRSKLTAVRAALQRLEDGTYGECAVCGEPIGDKRLAAVPTATHCIQHAD